MHRVQHRVGHESKKARSADATIPLDEPRYFESRQATITGLNHLPKAKRDIVKTSLLEMMEDDWANEDGKRRLLHLQVALYDR